MAETMRDVAFFDESRGGVTFSGGEPLLQETFVQALLEACKVQELHTAVDTSGAVAWRTLEVIRPYVDLFLYDVKLMDNEQHRAATGAGNRLILENLQRLATGGAAIQLRVALVPGWNDDEANLRSTAALAKSLAGVQGISLLPFHNTARDKYGRLGIEYKMQGVREPTEGEIQTAVAVLRESGLPVTVGG
jgi:pyruvate formate lyase activating enzyme